MYAGTLSAGKRRRRILSACMPGIRCVWVTAARSAAGVCQYLYFCTSKASKASTNDTMCLGYRCSAAGTHFTCFTGTQVQILTRARRAMLGGGRKSARGYVQVLPQLTCFTSTRAQILTLAALRGRELCYNVRVEKCKYCLSLLAILEQEHKY